MFTRRWLCGTVVLLGAVLLAAPRAGAEPVAWDYTGQVVTTGPNFTTRPGAGPPDPHVLYGQYQFPLGLVTYPTEQVQFAGVTGVGSGGGTVTGFQMRASTAFDGYNVFSADIHTFNFGFTILDKMLGASGTLTFQGNVSGSMTSNSLVGVGQVNLQVGFTGATQQSLVLGDHLYTVSVAPFSFQAGAYLSAPLPFVSSYQNVPVSVVVTDVPEPGTLALAASGLAGLGLRAWRRRRARRAAA